MIDDDELAKTFSAGTIRNWKNGSFQKQPNGKWKEVTSGRKKAAPVPAAHHSLDPSNYFKIEPTDEQPILEQRKKNLEQFSRLPEKSALLIGHACADDGVPLESLHFVVEKIRQGIPLRKAVRWAPPLTYKGISLAAVEMQIRNRSCEHLVLMIGDQPHVSGPEFTEESSGGHPAYSCVVTKEMFEAAKDKMPILTHNHPDSSPLSSADYSLGFMLNLADLRATTRDGGAWRMKRPPEDWISVAGAWDRLSDAQLDHGARRFQKMLEDRGIADDSQEAEELEHEACTQILIKAARDPKFVRAFKAATDGAVLERVEEDRKGANEEQEGRRAPDRTAQKEGKVIAKAVEDAPNYRWADGLTGGCSGCLWAKGQQCTMYGFQFEDGMTCDDWAARPPSTPSQTDVVMGPPPQPNRKPFPYVGCIQYNGLLIYIENEPGSTRSGVDNNGNGWSVVMRHHYGELAGTRGADNEPIDVFVGPYSDAELCYVIDQRVKPENSTAHAPALTWDEQKLMIGFKSEAEAVTAWSSNYDSPQPEPTVTSVTLTELRDLFNQSVADFSPIVKAFLLEGDFVIDDELSKGRKADPVGWISYRGDGHWQKVSIAPHKWKQIDAREVKWERDPTRKFSDLKAGDVVEVGGRDGLYMIDPKEPLAPGSTVQVVSLASGSKEKVRRTTVIGLRPKQARPKKGPPPKPQKKIPHTTAARMAPIPDTPVVKPGEKSRKASVFKDSQAVPGTIRHKLENGAYQMQRVADRSGRRMRWAIYVPPEDKAALFKEMTPLLHKVSKQIANKRPMTRMKNFGVISSEYEEILSGAKLGMMMALRNFDGSRPFIPWADQYMTAYAADAKRSSLSSAIPLTDRKRRLLHTFLAASFQAQKASPDKKATDEQIADRWYIRKNQVFGGHSMSARPMGSYMTPSGETLNQGHDLVPMEDWQVVTPTGKPSGRMLPGKLSLVKEMKALASGDRVVSMMGDESHDSAFPPEMPAGLVEHVKSELELAVEKMKEPHRTVARMIAGLHDDTPLDTGGEAAPYHKIAEALGFEPGKGSPTSIAAGLRRQLAHSGLVAETLDKLRAIAHSKGFTAANWIDRIAGHEPLGDAVGRNPTQAPWGSSHAELKVRWGDDWAVGAYYTAMRHGEASGVAKQLDARKAGKLSPTASAALHKKIDDLNVSERAATWRRYVHRTVDPEAAKPEGPQYGNAEAMINDEHRRAAIRSHLVKLKE